MTSFSSMNLHPIILKALDSKGYKTPTPIQEMSIPHLLGGGDMLGIAQTGTGKTAAFSLPIINNLAANKVKTKPARMRCLILTPTRELASQIEENVKEYGKGLGLSSLVIFGGVSSRPQILKLSKGMDIIIATPGRLLDLMGEGHILFEQLETFVLDEADRMLDMGFIRDVNKIIARLPKKRQTLLFSATMPQDIAKLSQKLLVNPKRVEVTPESTTVEKIDQKINLVEKANKPLLLKSILKDKYIKHVLVFTKTKHGANRVVKHLEKDNIAAAAIHGNKSQGARERALSGFKSGKVRVLVATDIAARGIDVSHITHVINYDLPDDPKSYVHRIGRTARAGREGIAISFCDQTEKLLLKNIEKCISYKIPVDEKHAYHGAPAEVRPANNNNRPAKKKPSQNTKRRRTRQARGQGKKQVKSLKTKIWVDADACPKVIKEVLFKFAVRLNIPICLVANSYMNIPHHPLISFVKVESGDDVADIYIAEHVLIDDLVVTADIPLASEIVKSGALAINPRGGQYTEENIGERLSMRDFMKELRDGGLVTGGPDAFGPKDKASFSNSLNQILVKKGYS